MEGTLGNVNMVLAGEVPAHCFYVFIGSNDRKLMYIRAADADGLTWNSPLELVHGFPTGADMSLVGGKPAVTYFDQSQGGSNSTTYIAALDSFGDSWGNSEPASLGRWAPRLCDLTGNPGISCASPGTLHFVRGQ